MATDIALLARPGAPSGPGAGPTTPPQPLVDRAPAVARVATAADVPAIGRSLSRAFFEDPCWRYFYPDPEDRKRLGERFYGIGAKLTVPAGHTYTNAGEPLGAACFLPPDAPHPSTLAGIRAAGLLAPWHLGLAPLRRILAVVGDLTRLRPKTPHWYLMTLGVDPSAQGRGLSKLLVAPVLAQADQAQQEVYLETFRRENLAIYERWGFRLERELYPDKGRGPLGFTMRRAPKA